MRKRLSIPIALAAASLIAVATVIPAVAVSPVSMSCGGTGSLGQGVSYATWHTSGNAYTKNMQSSYCYWLYVEAYVDLGNGGYYDLGSRTTTNNQYTDYLDGYSGDVVGVHGQHNMCNDQYYHVCNGYVDSDIQD